MMAVCRVISGINDFGYKEKGAKVISGISDTCDINNIP